MSEDGRCYWLQGLFIGGLVGAALGIFFAPESGQETRREIGKQKRMQGESWKVPKAFQREIKKGG